MGHFIFLDVSLKPFTVADFGDIIINILHFPLLPSRGILWHFTIPWCALHYLTLVILLFFCFAKRKVTKEKATFFESLRAKKDSSTLWLWGNTIWPRSTCGPIGLKYNNWGRV